MQIVSVSSHGNRYRKTDSGSVDLLKLFVKAICDRDAEMSNGKVWSPTKAICR